MKAINLLDIDMLSFVEVIRDYIDTYLNSYLFELDLDRKGLHELNYRKYKERGLRNIARKLIQYGILKSSESIPPQKRIYEGTPEYYSTKLGKTVLSKLKMTKETVKRNE